MQSTHDKGDQTFNRRGLSLGFKTSGRTTMASDSFGNYGLSVSKVCPKDFTLTPVNRLEPMPFDLNKLPRDMPISSERKETDVELIR